MSAPGPPAPGPPAPGPTVEVVDEQATVALDSTQLGELARAVLVDGGIRQGTLVLSFVDEETIAALNRRFLDVDGPTDVLAFPLDVEPARLDGDIGGIPVLVGDVTVCPAVAERNAATRSISTHDELALLVVHGMLHVLGMDHAGDDEAAAMQASERRLLEQHFR